MFFRRIHLIFSAMLIALTAETSFAQESALRTEVDAFAPNKSINEEILAFADDPQTAERSAMIRARTIARNGVFKVTNVFLGSVDGEDYCILDIHHDIYEPPDTKRVLEMVIGFGSTSKDALKSARIKAMQRIRENPRSRPNLRNSTMPIQSQDIHPMPIKEERDFIEDNIRFWGKNDDWRVYLKFEYLEMK
jgi:hypothetical protein